MLEQFNIWLYHWEPFWLAGILFFEGFVGILTLTILVIEYFYDKKLEESKSKKRKKSKRVKIIIDSEGNASITEAPKGLDISVEHQGEK